MYAETFSCRLGFITVEADDEYVTAVKFNTVCKNNPNKITALAIKELNEYLNCKREVFTVKYKLNATQFQNKVWQALCEIPYGETVSYSDIAKSIGNPKACRAVGAANNKNPIPIIVPCHRVVGKNGALVGYAGGLDIKKMLLKIEKDKNKNGV